MRRRFVPAILVALALAGCAAAPSGPGVAAPPPQPAPPADFGKPVAVRAPQVGEDPRVYAGREKAGRLAANRRLVNDAAYLRDYGAAVAASAH